MEPPNTRPRLRPARGPHSCGDTLPRPAFGPGVPLNRPGSACPCVSRCYGKQPGVEAWGVMRVGVGGMMNSAQAKRAARKRWEKRPVRRCVVCGDEHRCYVGGRRKKKK